MNDTEVAELDIEKYLPSFLWWTIVDDPFVPKIVFRFGNYALNMAWEGDIRILNDVSYRFFTGLPHDHQRIWDFLEPGETTSNVMAVDRKMAGITFAPQDGVETYHALIDFRLRDKNIRAAYVEEYDTIVISESYKVIEGV